MLVKNYVYTEKELTEALNILRRKSKTRLPCIIIFSVLSLICILRGICILLSAKGDAYGEIIVSTLLFASAVLLYFFGRYCAEAPFADFAEYNSSDGNARTRNRHSGFRDIHYRSPQRTFTFDNRFVKITADFAEYDFNGKLQKLRSKTEKYRLGSCTVYENAEIFLFSQDMLRCDAVPKNIFSDEELKELKKLLAKHQIFTIN